MAVALAVCCALAFWAFDALPFQDLPAHAGLFALRHRLSSSPFEQRFFVFLPHLGPYSLFRFSGELLLRAVGPERAARAIMTLAVLSLPAALAWSRGRLHRDGAATAACFGVCMACGFVTTLGFASYLLGMAALVAGLTLWLGALEATARQESSPGREVAVAALALLVLLCHGYAFVILVALAVVSALAWGGGLRLLVPLRAMAPALAAAAWMSWQARTTEPPVGLPGPTPGVHFVGVLDKLGLLATPTLMTRWGADVLVGAFLWAIVVAGQVATARAVRTTIPRASDPRRSRLRALLAAEATLVAGVAALPQSVGWFGFVDGRLVPLVLVLGVLAVDLGALGPSLARAFQAGVPAGAAVLVAVLWAASLRFQAEASGWRNTLAAIPAGSRVLNLPIDPNSDVFTGHPFVHYDKLAMAARPTVVSDVWFHQGTAIYPTRDNPALRLPGSYSESDLRRVDWPLYRLDDWDYVLVRTRPGAGVPAVPAALALVTHPEGSGFWLFRTH